MPLTPFTDIEALAYYYKHGYKIMNPFCREMTANSHYKVTLDEYIRNIDSPTNPKQAEADELTARVLQSLKGKIDSKSWSLLGIDDRLEKTVVSGSAKEEHEELVSAYRSMGQTEGLPTEEQILAGSKKQASDRIAALWQLVKDTKTALAGKDMPKCDWVIRGDTGGMVEFLRTQGVTIPESSSAASANLSTSSWSTNQFFSTSEGDELASLAGKALVWLIRVQGKSEGRVGGIYESEVEILFPYDVSLSISGVVSVGAEDQIAGLELTGFDKSEELRAKILAVYKANTFPSNQIRFLICSE